VPFGELDHKRLVAQHHEAHMLWKHVELGRRWLEWHTPDRRGLLRDLHDRAATEMALRGFAGHKTPLVAVVGGFQRSTYATRDVLRELQRRDRAHLVERWGGVYRGRVPLLQLTPGARRDYATLGVDWDAGPANYKELV
jgi:hypothetical protein